MIDIYCAKCGAELSRTWTPVCFDEQTGNPLYTLFLKCPNRKGWPDKHTNEFVTIYHYGHTDLRLFKEKEIPVDDASVEEIPFTDMVRSKRSPSDDGEMPDGYWIYYLG